MSISNDWDDLHKCQFFWKCEYCTSSLCWKINRNATVVHARSLNEKFEIIAWQYILNKVSICDFSFLPSITDKISGKWISNIYLMIFRSKNRFLITFLVRGVVFFSFLFFFSFFLLDQASNIEVLISLTSSFFQILRIKFYFLASILSAALQWKHLLVENREPRHKAKTLLGIFGIFCYCMWSINFWQKKKSSKRTYIDSYITYIKFIRNLHHMELFFFKHSRVELEGKRTKEAWLQRA